MRATPETSSLAAKASVTLVACQASSAPLTVVTGGVVSAVGVGVSLGVGVGLGVGVRWVSGSGWASAPDRGSTRRS